MSVITIGIDLAKNVFAVHGVDENGAAVLVKPKVLRVQLPVLIAQLLPCLTGLEACSGVNHWARRFQTHDHPAKLMAPSGSSPSASPANAARTTPSMRPPSAKRYPARTCVCPGQGRTPADHSHPASHPARLVEERTATYNRMRGLMAEFGMVLPLKVAGLRREVGARFENRPGYANLCIGDLLAHADQFDVRVVE